jgi:hypothetical protein
MLLISVKQSTVRLLKLHRVSLLMLCYFSFNLTGLADTAVLIWGNKANNTCPQLQIVVVLLATLQLLPCLCVPHVRAAFTVGASSGV